VFARIGLSEGADSAKIPGNQGLFPENMSNSSKMDRKEVLRIELATLRMEHEDLDHAIDALHGTVAPDMLRLQRMKRQKLALKDQIRRLEDELTPDIIA